MFELHLIESDDVVDVGNARTTCSAVKAWPPKVHYHAAQVSAAVERQPIYGMTMKPQNPCAIQSRLPQL